MITGFLSMGISIAKSRVESSIGGAGFGNAAQEKELGSRSGVEVMDRWSVRTGTSIEDEK